MGHPESNLPAVRCSIFYAAALAVPLNKCVRASAATLLLVKEDNMRRRPRRGPRN
jgi:hypothetical protein